MTKLRVHHWLMTIVAGIIAGVASIIVSPSVRELIKAAWVGTTSALRWFFVAKIQLPVWLVTLLSLVSLIVAIRIIVALSRSKQEDERPWHDYKSDNFLGVDWRWDYDVFGRMTTPLAFCPDDQTALVFEIPQFQGDIFLRCDCCGKRTNTSRSDATDVENTVKRLAVRKIDTGEWEQVVNSQPADS
ncbi:MAG: hypothetical protein K9K65_15170 [Desulfarculaceae bacterium]|nr:hypothetical protein [Desulfarculaceae bacterium]MCF8048794.1 hypothetical protein [Desulfarculaceae bacterium]MCF8099177.1 hypothetical protein [Desulfarculaceae bacterium]MCF8122875.1 hypothetical protein [Desulfarculaceae bacterium]